MDDIEIHCDICGIKCSSNEGSRLQTRYRFYRHLCISCHRSTAREDEIKSREEDKALKRAEKYGMNEWEKQKRRLLR